MTKNSTDDRDNTMRLLSAGKIASAVLAVVGAASAENFDIDDHPASLDLWAQKMTVQQENPFPPKTNLSSEDKIAAGVLAVVGSEPDEYRDLDDHPGSLDLTVQA